MCGIAAVFDRTGRAVPLNLDRLAHRGPDGRGEWTSEDGSVWLGHTRLAIVDLSPTGAQPMHDPETGNVIVFNGEIYNHRRLREQLASSGVTWRGTSDTETLLVGYRVWGAGLLPRLKGMFAFVIFDHAKKCLFAARSHAGIKPLYYSNSNGVVRFASEVRALIGPQPQEWTRSGLSAYLQWGSCPEKEFIFPGITMLSAGYFMVVKGDASIELTSYWPPPAFPAIEPDRVPRRVRELLEASIEEHLMSDVPIASFLSGGIDSSVITALAARAMGGKNLRTFSVGFPYQEFDETAVAQEVAQRYGTQHHRIEVGEEEAISLVREAVEKMDAPSVDAINTYIVSQKVTEHGIKVALSGLGADELFGGYPSFRDTPRLRALAMIPQGIRQALALLGPFGARLADLPTADITAIAIWRRRLWSDRMLEDAGLPISPLDLDAPPELCDSFAKISWAELTVYMRQMLLRDSDQMSMAVSLELRVPFLDRELIDYVLSVPAREKTRHPGIKGLLVEACRDLLPQNVYDRPKMGFSLPMDRWMRGPLKSFAVKGLDEVERREMLAPGTVPRLQQQFDDRKLHWTRLWSVVVLGHYLARLADTVGVENIVAAASV